MARIDSRHPPSFELESAEIALGRGPVAGIDEAGRGPWAGPVVAAAVILDPARIPSGIDDSKVLDAEDREVLYERIVLTAWQLGLGALCGGLAAALTGERLLAAWDARVAAALVYHIVIATAIAYVLWYRLLASLSATIASLTTLAVPVVGVLGAMALVGDRPSALDWAGFVLVEGGTHHNTNAVGQQHYRDALGSLFGLPI